MASEFMANIADLTQVTENVSYETSSSEIYGNVDERFNFTFKGEYCIALSDDFGRQEMSDISSIHAAIKKADPQSKLALKEAILALEGRVTSLGFGCGYKDSTPK